MTVRKILPHMDARRTHLRPRVTSFLSKIPVIMPRTGSPGISLASGGGVIALTFTA
jgi:hypothetical protein